MPERDPRALWEKLMLDGFQAGLAWITVLRKRDAFRAAFKDFDPDKVAALRGGATSSGCSATPGSSARGRRSSRRSPARGSSARCATPAKTSPTSAGRSPTARCCAATASRSRPRRRSPRQVSKELKRRGFKFVGPTIVYAWMQAVGIVNDHSRRLLPARSGLVAEDPPHEAGGSFRVIAGERKRSDGSLTMS